MKSFCNFFSVTFVIVKRPHLRRHHLSRLLKLWEKKKLPYFWEEAQRSKKQKSRLLSGLSVCLSVSVSDALLIKLTSCIRHTHTNARAHKHTQNFVTSACSYSEPYLSYTHIVSQCCSSAHEEENGCPFNTNSHPHTPTVHVHTHAHTQTHANMHAHALVHTLLHRAPER